MLEHRYVVPSSRAKRNTDSGVSFLEELDEDLLAELDEIVRQNQLAFLPFAKSGRAEAELLEQYTDLAGQLEQARERRIDSMQLRSRLHEDEERSASLNKFRVGSYDRGSSTPVTPRANRTPTRQSPSPAASPALLPQDAGSDLLFEMDEERAGKKIMPCLQSDPTSPSLRALDQGRSRGLGMTSQEDSWFDARGKPLASSVSSDVSSLGDSFPRPQYSASPVASRTPQVPHTTAGFSSTSTPWSAARSTPAKTELKDIMAEASATRPSNLTLAMNARISEPAKGTQKLSQKERKKLQQQQLLQRPESSQLPSTSSAVSPSLASSTPKSPWQLNRPAPKQDLAQIQASEFVIPPSPEQHPTRPPMRSTMTMRQTVAGTPPVNKPDTLKQQSRSLSNPVITPARPVPPQIQSIRHTPAPVSPNLLAIQSSMTDILSQQQTEKIAVKEAVAKRSLQEIQQQQEFEEWFDSESRRVQEEDAAAAAVVLRDGKGKRSRGRARGGQRTSSGRGGVKNTAGEASSFPATERRASSHTPDIAHAAADTSRDRGRGRGRRRGES